MVFRYPSFSQWPHAGQIWGCLLGVWMLSEGVRMVSECVRQMSEVCRCHINWKKFDYCHTNYMRPLLPVPIFVQKRPHGRYFQGGVVGFISGSTANFFVLGGQVMDIGKQWGWCWRIFLTWPRYPPTLLIRDQFGWLPISTVLTVSNFGQQSKDLAGMAWPHKSESQPLFLPLVMFYSMI